MGLQLRVVVDGVQLDEWMKYLVDCWSLTGAVQGMCCCCGWCLCVEDHGVIQKLEMTWNGDELVLLTQVRLVQPTQGLMNV